MAVTLKNAYLAQVPATNTTVYTAPAGTIARIVSCTITNDTTSVVTLSAHKVPSGGSVGDPTLILNAKSLASKETYKCWEIEGQVLDAADLLSAIASAADQITMSLDVVEIV